MKAGGRRRGLTATRGRVAATAPAGGDPPRAARRSRGGATPRHHATHREAGRGGRDLPLGAEAEAAIEGRVSEDVHGAGAAPLHGGAPRRYEGAGDAPPPETRRHREWPEERGRPLLLPDGAPGEQDVPGEGALDARLQRQHRRPLGEERTEERDEVLLREGLPVEGGEGGLVAGGGLGDGGGGHRVLPFAGRDRGGAGQAVRFRARAGETGRAPGPLPEETP